MIRRDFITMLLCSALALPQVSEASHFKLLRRGLAGLTPPVSTAGKVIGTNLDGSAVLYYGTSDPLVDVMKGGGGGDSRPWNHDGTNTATGANQIFFNAANLPTNLGGLANIITRIQVANPTYGKTTRHVAYISYDAVISFGNNQTQTSANAQINHQGVTRTARRIEFDVVYTPNGHVITMTSAGSPTANDFIKIARIDRENLLLAGVTWTPEYVANCAAYSHIRTMDFQQNNTANPYTLTSPSYDASGWSNTVAENQVYGAVPFRALVELANAANVNLLFVAPSPITDAQTTALLSYARDNLVNNLIFEASANETWNSAGGFYNFSYATIMGKAKFTNQADDGLRWWGYRSIQLAKIARTVFAAVPSKLQVFQGLQGASSSNFTSQCMQGYAQASSDSVAAGNGALDYKTLFTGGLIAPYYGGTWQVNNGATGLTAQNLADRRTLFLSWANATDDSGLAAIFGLMNGGAGAPTVPGGLQDTITADALGTANTWPAILNPIGWQLAGYEGHSPHWNLIDAPSGYAAADLATILAFENRVKADPRYGTTTDYSFRAYGAIMSFMTNFNDIGPTTGNGVWGAADSIYNLNSVRRNAIIAYNTNPSSVLTLSGGISQNEGNSGTTPFVFTVTRSNTQGTATATWTFDPGTTDVNDYVGGLPTGGTLNFPDGVATATITINIQGDTTPEDNEVFKITVFGGFRTTIVANASTITSTILNDDAAAGTLVINDTFTETTYPKALTAHTGESGVTWAIKTASTLNTAAAGSYAIQTPGYLADATSSTGLDLAVSSVSLGSTEFDIVGTLFTKVATSFTLVHGFGASFSTTIANGYYILYNYGSGILSLSRRDGASETSTALATYTAGAFAAGSTHDITLRRRGNSITVLLDSVPVIGPITDATYAGQVPFVDLRQSSGSGNGNAGLTQIQGKSF